MKSVSQRALCSLTSPPSFCPTSSLGCRSPYSATEQLYDPRHTSPECGCGLRKPRHADQITEETLTITMSQFTIFNPRLFHLLLLLFGLIFSQTLIELNARTCFASRVQCMSERRVTWVSMYQGNTILTLLCTCGCCVTVEFKVDIKALFFIACQRMRVIPDIVKL